MSWLNLFEGIECGVLVALIDIAREQVRAGRKKFTHDTFVNMMMGAMLLWIALEAFGVFVLNYDLTYMESCYWYERMWFSAGPLGYKCVNASDVAEFETTYKDGGYRKVRANQRMF